MSNQEDNTTAPDTIGIAPPSTTAPEVKTGDNVKEYLIDQIKNDIATVNKLLEASINSTNLSSNNSAVDSAQRLLSTKSTLISRLIDITRN